MKKIIFAFAILSVMTGCKENKNAGSSEAQLFSDQLAAFKQSGDSVCFKQAEALASMMDGVIPDGKIASSLVQLYEIDGDISHLKKAESMIKALGGSKYLEGKPAAKAPKSIREALTIRERATRHPRLILDDAAFADMKKQIGSGSNPSLAKIHGMLMSLTDSYGNVTFTKEFDESHIRILAVSRRALAYITNNAYAYRYTGDRKYLDAAAKAMDEVCSFDNWNSRHFLDAAEMAAGVAIGYDWLWKDLSPELRAKAERAMKEYAIEASKNKEHAWFYGATNNWNQVCNLGVTLAAIAGRDVYGTESGRIITKSIQSNRIAVVANYYPDGNYLEGQNYWGYGTSFQAMYCTTLQSALGADFGLSDVEGFDKTAEYMSFCYAPSHKMFNYYDSPDYEAAQGAMWYFASRFDRPDLLATEQLFLENGRTALDNDRIMPFVMAWAAKCKPFTGRGEIKHFYSSSRKNPVVMVRGDWSCSEDDFYLGFKGGSGSDPHAHLDGGSFVFDAYGKRWACDYGMVDYAPQEARLKKTGGSFWSFAQDSQRWDVIPLGNEWHNTLTVNGKRHSVSGRANLVEAIDEPGRQGGTMDLSQLFPDLEKAIRTVTTDGRSLTVTDSLVTGKPANIRWTMVTPADCKSSGDGVTLTSDDKTMNIAMTGTDCVWSIRQCDDEVAGKNNVLDADFTIPAGSTKITITLK